MPNVMEGPDVASTREKKWPHLPFSPGVTLRESEALLSSSTWHWNWTSMHEQLLAMHRSSYLFRLIAVSSGAWGLPWGRAPTWPAGERRNLCHYEVVWQSGDELESWRTLQAKFAGYKHTLATRNGTRQTLLWMDQCSIQYAAESLLQTQQFLRMYRSPNLENCWNRIQKVMWQHCFSF